MVVVKLSELTKRAIAELLSHGCTIEPYTVHGLKMLCIIYPLHKKSKLRILFAGLSPRSEYVIDMNTTGADRRSGGK